MQVRFLTFLEATLFLAALPACEPAGGALGLPLGLTLGTYGAAAAESLATLAKSSLPPHRRAEQAKRSPRASPAVSHACGYTIEDDKGLGSD